MRKIEYSVCHERGLRFFLCPTLVTNWIFHLSNFFPSLKFTIFLSSLSHTVLTTLLILIVCRTRVTIITLVSVLQHSVENRALWLLLENWTIMPQNWAAHELTEMCSPELPKNLCITGSSGINVLHCIHSLCIKINFSGKRSIPHFIVSAEFFTHMIIISW